MIGSFPQGKEAGEKQKQKNVIQIWMSQTHFDLTIWYSYLTQSYESSQSAEMFIRLARNNAPQRKCWVPLDGKSRAEAASPADEYNRSKGESS